MKQYCRYCAYLVCGDVIKKALECATEVAYKNGYEQGVKDFSERVKTYYRHTTSRPLPATVEYYIDQIAKDMIGKEDGDG